MSHRLFTTACATAILLGLAAAAAAGTLRVPRPTVDRATSGGNLWGTPPGSLGDDLPDRLAQRLAQPIDLDEVDESLLATAIFWVTNQQRMAHGLSPLGHQAQLDQAAAGHARRMAELDFYSHHDPFEGAVRGPKQRAAAAGVANPRVAENIHDLRALDSDGGLVYVLGGRGRFSATPDGQPIEPHTYVSFARQVVGEWMASPGHRGNILSPDARQLGVGVSFYWRDGGWPFVKAVQNFQMFEDVRIGAAARASRHAEAASAESIESVEANAAPPHVCPRTAP